MLLRDQKIRTNELNFERKEKRTQKFMLVLMGLALALVITACNDEKTAGAPEDVVLESDAESGTEPVWDGNKVILEFQKLADGVFAVIPEGATEMAKSG